MEKLKIFVVRPIVKYKKKRWFSNAIPIKQDIFVYDGVFITTTFEDACNQFLEKNEMDSLDEYLPDIKSSVFRGFDFEFYFEEISSDEITMETLMSDVSANTLIKYLKQEGLSE